MDGDRKVLFFLGGRGGGDGIDRVRLLWWRLGNDNFLTASRTIDFRAGAGGIHGQFLFAMRTIKNNIHNWSLSLSLWNVLLR